MKKKQSYNCSFKISIADRILKGESYHKLSNELGIDRHSIREWVQNVGKLKDVNNKSERKRLKGGGRNPNSLEYKDDILEFIKRCNKVGVAINYKTIINYLLFFEELKVNNSKTGFNAISNNENPKEVDNLEDVNKNDNEDFTFFYKNKSVNYMNVWFYHFLYRHNLDKRIILYLGQPIKADITEFSLKFLREVINFRKLYNINDNIQDYSSIIKVDETSIYFNMPLSNTNTY